MNASKKKLIGIIAILILILFTFAIAIGIKMINSPLENDTTKFTAYLNSYAKLDNNYFPPDYINKQLEILNNTSLSEEKRYYALIVIFGLLNNAYFDSNLPIYRDASISLDKYASKNFKKQYKKGDFYMACADSKCGETTPPDISRLVGEIKNLPIEDGLKQSIILNIKTASHVPYDTNFNKSDKLSSYDIAVKQLISSNNSEASSSANKLKLFVKNKYGQNL